MGTSNRTWYRKSLETTLLEVADLSSFKEEPYSFENTTIDLLEVFSSLQVQESGQETLDNPDFLEVESPFQVQNPNTRLQATSENSSTVQKSAKIISKPTSGDWQVPAMVW